MECWISRDWRAMRRSPGVLCTAVATSIATMNRTYPAVARETMNQKRALGSRHRRNIKHNGVFTILAIRLVPTGSGA